MKVTIPRASSASHAWLLLARPMLCGMFSFALMLTSVSFTTSQTTVVVTPSTASLSSGGTITLSFVVNNVSNLHGVHTILTFNNQVTQVTAIAQGSFLGSTGEQVFFEENPPPGPSVYSVICDQAILSPGGVSGSGVLLNVTFYAVSGGLGPITISVADLRDPFNSIIPATLLSGSITVVDSSVNVHAIQGWNMTSLPVQRVDGRKTIVFPTAVSQAYAYGNSYYASDTLLNGVGYWIKFATGQDITVQGASISRDTIDIHSGWNMIGSVTRPVSVASIITSPPNVVSSSYFRYNGAYSVADSIVAGRGYWVKARTASFLILDSHGSALARPTVAPAERPLHAEQLVVDNGNTGVQYLYFINQPVVGSTLEMYELPPRPPSGGFDVRYASNRMFESSREGGQNEYPISISSPKFPVSISWSNIIARGASLVVGNAVMQLNGGGSVNIMDQSTTVVLKLGGKQDVSREFSLDHNYPNPFNPSTSFRYRLPVDSHVKIRVFDGLGEEIAVLVDRMEPAGTNRVEWSPDQSVSSGVYFCHFVVSKLSGEPLFSGSRKILFVK